MSIQTRENDLLIQTILKDLTSSSRQNPKAQYNLKLRQGFTLILSQRQTFFFLVFGVRKTQHIIMGSLSYLAILWYWMVTFSLTLFRRTSAFLRYFFFFHHMINHVYHLSSFKFNKLIVSKARLFEFGK